MTDKKQCKRYTLHPVFQSLNYRHLRHYKHTNKYLFTYDNLKLCLSFFYGKYESLMFVNGSTIIVHIME